MVAQPIESRGVAPRPSRRRRAPWVLAGIAALVLAALVVALTAWSGATLSRDPVALATVRLQPLAGTLSRAQAYGPDGRSIPIAVRHGRLLPLEQLTPGELISVEVRIRRPGWLSWALGAQRTERLTLRAPVVHVSTPWLTVASGSPVRVSFDQPVSTVAYGNGGYLAAHQLPGGAARSVTLGMRGAPGTVEVAAAARPWERLGAPVAVTWFPPSRSPVVLASPAPGTDISPTTAIRLTFSAAVADLLGTSLPQLSPTTAGSWRETDSHSLVFTPSGFGPPLDSELRVVLPHAVAVAQASGAVAPASQDIAWSVPPASTLRLQQLLAQAGYLPVDWRAASPPVAPTPAAQAAAAVAPPSGAFSWRYPNIPRELRALWSPGQPNPITRGAVMTFEHSHGLVVDAVAGPIVWRALLTDTIAGRRRSAGYSYVYVHRNVPQLLTLWSDGHKVLSSPGNTGVPAAPTVLGTFPVFEHIPVGTMSGTNPDGSHYHDPGIRYISYFNGGDAIHAFTRASFGTPQSLGCVELPLASAAKVWPYTPIGTLVTVEN